MTDKGRVSRTGPQSLDVILCSEGFQLSTMRVNSNSVSLGHSLDCIERYLKAVLQDHLHCIYHWFYEDVLWEKVLV